MPTYHPYVSVPLDEDSSDSSENEIQDNMIQYEHQNLHTAASNTASGSAVDAVIGNTVALPKPPMYAPPPYSECDSETGYGEHDSLLVEPPSYEEVQQLKAQEAGGELPLPPYSAAPGGCNTDSSRGNGVQFVRISSLGGIDSQTAEVAEEQLLGTDVMFFVAFTVAFIFNWLGFILLLCFCQTIAGRTGSLAGFGLSLAKWAIIVRHSTDLVGDSNSWLLWVIMVLGFLICMRAILQYLHAKREWQHVPDSSRQRFFFFY